MMDDVPSAGVVIVIGVGKGFLCQLDGASDLIEIHQTEVVHHEADGAFPGGATIRGPWVPEAANVVPQVTNGERPVGPDVNLVTVRGLANRDLVGFGVSAGASCRGHVYYYVLPA